LGIRFSRALHLSLGSLVLTAVLFSGLTIDAPAVQADLRHKDKIVSDLKCLALNIYWEARSEPLRGAAGRCRRDLEPGPSRGLSR